MKQFFKALPGNTGLAFVLVQHLDPNHESLMADLLARQTPMPVAQVVDATPVEANHVYVIPPNHSLSIESGILHLAPPTERRGMRMPIDHFLRSLAEDRGEKAICVILSGTGSDGTMGLREIKGHGGMTMVQEPATAQYDGMPHSALATGLVDYRLAVEDMGPVLVRYTQHPYVRGETLKVESDAEPADELAALIAIIRNRTGHDFRHYKKGTLGRRVARRMGLATLEKMYEYLDLLRISEDEVHKLVRDLLIGVTSFFREPQAFEMLMTSIAPALVARAGPNEPLRVWIPGCSTGEEAYSVAMVFQEAIRQSGKTVALQVFATDLDTEALDVARAGIYPLSATAEIPQDCLTQYCSRESEHVTINKSLRETVVFARQNLISDPPFSRLDFISCRNLLIYLDNEIQARVIRLFHFALRDSGYLFLGNSETVGPRSDLFRTISKKWRIYSRLKTPVDIRGTEHYAVIGAGTSVSPPVAGVRGRPATAKRLGDSVWEKLIREYAPAAVLVDRGGNALFYHGAISSYLEMPSGTATHEILALARGGMRTAMRTALQKAAAEKNPVESGPIAMAGSGAKRMIRLKVWPVDDAEGTLLVCFIDETERRPNTKSSPEDESLVKQLEYELKATREDLQSTIEEVETGNEELKAANEEVMSMNEELQSTNEELETSKEELQSLNEELSTVNNQLLEKLHELESANNDLANFLSSTEIATVFLDTDLRIRRFTPSAIRMFSLIEADCGRPIGDVAQRYKNGNLTAECQRVLAKLIPFREEVRANNGNWFQLNIRPYRTVDNRIDGVVITFADITEIKQAYGEAQTRERQLRTIADALPVLIAQIDLEHRFRLVNAAYEDWFDLRSDRLLGEPLCVAFGEDAYRNLCLPLQEASRGKIVEIAGQLHHTRLGEREVKVTWIPETDSEGHIVGFFSLITDVSDQQRMIQTIDRERRQLETFIEQAPVCVAMFDNQLTYLAHSSRWLDLYAGDEPLVGRPYESVHCETTAEWRQVLHDALGGKASRSEEDRWLLADGTPKWVRWSVHPWITELGTIGGIIISTDDITPYKQIEHRLLATQEDLKRAQAVASIGSWRIDLLRNQMVWSPESYRILGIPEGSTASYDVFLGQVHPEDRHMVDGQWRNPSDETFEFEHRLLVDGEVKWVLEKGQWERAADGKRIGAFGVTQDVTLRRQSEDQIKEANARLAGVARERGAHLASLSQALAQAEEKERDRLHEVLHDHVQPALVAARLGLSGVSERTSKTDMLRAVNDAKEHISQVILTARSLSAELSPPQIRERGLLPALESLRDQVRTSYGLKVQLSTQPEAEPASMTLRQLCFKAVRELLMNAVKHSGQDQVALDLRAEPQGWLRITVQDHGVGFDPAEENDGSGLRTLERRLEMVGGVLEIQSSKDKGSAVILRMPLQLTPEELIIASGDEAAGAI